MPNGQQPQQPLQLTREQGQQIAQQIRWNGVPALRLLEDMQRRKPDAMEAAVLSLQMAELQEMRQRELDEQEAQKKQSPNGPVEVSDEVRAAVEEAFSASEETPDPATKPEAPAAPEAKKPGK